MSDSSAWTLPHFSQRVLAADYAQLLPPTGANWRTRVIVPMNDGIVAVRVTDDQTYWYLPGGGVEPLETLPVCAVREVQEETHLTVAAQRLLYVREFRASIEFFIVAQHIGGTLQVGHDPEPEALPIEAVDIISFDRLENDASLTFYPVTLRQRLRRDLQQPPTRALYLGTVE